MRGRMGSFLRRRSIYFTLHRLGIRMRIPFKLSTARHCALHPLLKGTADDLSLNLISKVQDEFECPPAIEVHVLVCLFVSGPNDICLRRPPTSSLKTQTDALCSNAIQRASA